jgi:hypothetical protein
MNFRKWVILVTLILCSLAGCKSKESVTAREIDCAVRDVHIIDSEFSRAGSLTRWCARCENNFYLCVTNPNHDPVECLKVQPGPPCE